MSITAKRSKKANRSENQFDTASSNALTALNGLYPLAEVAEKQSVEMLSLVKKMEALRIEAAALPDTMPIKRETLEYVGLWLDAAKRTAEIFKSASKEAMALARANAVDLVAANSNKVNG
ncbi:MAG TPA: hypothetical protein VL356_13860 [Acidocella sp.]|nr:hypothetical protein [Acidocella sp.]